MQKYEDCLKFIPDLERYIKSKIKNSYWEDCKHDTLAYLQSKFNDIEITNLRGLMLNTANYFISKFHSIGNTMEFLDNMVNEEYENDIHFNVEQTPYNTYVINDKILNNLNNVSKTLLKPFQMQLDGMTIKEIALKLNTNENTIKTRIRRCKIELKK